MASENDETPPEQDEVEREPQSHAGKHPPHPPGPEGAAGNAIGRWLPLVAAGHTNKRIAEILFISENTAGVHVSNILGKLGVTTRTEAAAVAARLGLDRVES